MPTMVNPRSLFLQNANPRLLTAPNAGVILNPSSEFFHINNSGINNPAIITFNAMLIAMEGTVSFSCVGGTLTNIVGNTCALPYENMTGETATVKATITFRNNEYIDTVEVSKVYDGANGVTGLNNALMYAYQRSATTPVGTPGVVEWSFPAAAITTTNLQNGWKKAIPAGTDPLWITAASASSSGSLDTVQANEWTAPVILAQDGPAGAKGVNSAIITIYRRTTTTSAPTLPTATTTYTFSPAGLTGLNNSWTTTLPPMSGGQYLWASTATAVSVNATDDIPASEWAAAQMMVQNGTAGTRGNAIVARAIPGTIWSDSEAVLAISSQGFGTPQNRDIVTLYNTAANFSEQRYYDGDSWESLGAYFPGSVIVEKTLDAKALKAQTITGDKIAAGAITANSIKVTGSAGSLNRDPYFTDPTSWGLSVTVEARTNPGGAAPANTYIQGTADYCSAVSERFPVDSSKSYNISVSALGATGNYRRCQTLVVFFDGNGSAIVTSWGAGWGGNVTNNFYPGADNVWRTYRNGSFGANVLGRPIPPNAKWCDIRCEMNAGVNPGSPTPTDNVMCITGLRIDEMVSSVTIENGAVTAEKITANEVSAITGRFGVMRTADTGARIEVRDNLIEGYQWNNVKRFRLSA